MGDSFSANPAAIARLGEQFAEQAQQLGRSAESFGGSALQIADAFGLLGACDGAMEQYVKMAHSTVQGLEQLASLWYQTGGQLMTQADVYELTDEEQARDLGGIMRPLNVPGGGN